MPPRRIFLNDAHHFSQTLRQPVQFDPRILEMYDPATLREQEPADACAEDVCRLAALLADETTALRVAREHTSLVPVLAALSASLGAVAEKAAFCTIKLLNAGAEIDVEHVEWLIDAFVARRSPWLCPVMAAVSRIHNQQYNRLILLLYGNLRSFADAILAVAGEEAGMLVAAMLQNASPVIDVEISIFVPIAVQFFIDFTHKTPSARLRNALAWGLQVVAAGFYETVGDYFSDEAVWSVFVAAALHMIDAGEGMTDGELALLGSIIEYSRTARICSTLATPSFIDFCILCLQSSSDATQKAVYTVLYALIEMWADFSTMALPPTLYATLSKNLLAERQTVRGVAISLCLSLRKDRYREFISQGFIDNLPAFLRTETRPVFIGKAMTCLMDYLDYSTNDEEINSYMLRRVAQKDFHDVLQDLLETARDYTVIWYISNIFSIISHN